MNYKAYPMEGKYIPTEISNKRKAKKLMRAENPLSLEAGPLVAQEQVNMERVEAETAQSRTVDGRMPRLRSNVLAEEPIMMQTIKQEKTSPRGHCPSLPESRTGVQRKTKMYMMDSNMDWTKPRRRIVLSRKMTNSPSKKERPSPNCCPP